MNLYQVISKLCQTLSPLPLSNNDSDAHVKKNTMTITNRSSANSKIFDRNDEYHM